MRGFQSRSICGNNYGTSFPNPVFEKKQEQNSLADQAVHVTRHALPITGHVSFRKLLQDVAEFGQDQLLHGECDSVFGAGG